ncbi:MAG: YjbF family lipoprotein [Sphingomonadales bacterium]|nr:YjbF family lipoprotein [Sphingomonadales bacterium]
MKNIKTALLPVSLLLLLSACGADGVWQNAREVLVTKLSSADQEIAQTREEVENIPYASITAQLENTPPALMILGYVDGGRLQWISSNNVSMSTKAGRIVHTVGFEKDISYLEVVGDDFLGSQFNDYKTPRSYQIVMETKTPNISSERLNCEVKYKGEESIVILDYSYETLLLEEKCTSSAGWKVENLYWLDEDTGFVWRSRQGLVNGKYTMEINILKPFG